MQRSSCALALALLTLAFFACRDKSTAPSSTASTTPSTAPITPVSSTDRITREECAEGVDHAIALFDADSAMAAAAKMMRDTRESAITQCTTVATVRDHDCLMKSKTAYELGLCPMPGTR